MFKLTSEQKKKLGFYGVLLAFAVYFSSVSPTAPPNSPGFDLLDAVHLVGASASVVMILLGLFAPTKGDTPDVKQ